MHILITGANGFIGRNLTENLKAVRDGKRHVTGLTVEQIDTFDITDTPEQLAAYCRRADFVFHLAGVNRPQNEADFMTGNRDCLQSVLQLMEDCGNTCPVMLSSSVQAALDNPYGESKRAGETLLFDYARRTGAKALVYRFPNVFGKWCRPDYNSAVATFCHHKANDLPITVNDRNTVLTLVYIDDLVDELLRALLGRESRDGEYCTVPRTYTQSLGSIVDLLQQFKNFEQHRYPIHFPEHSFEKALFSTYLSYLPPERAVLALPSSEDARGSFTELVHTHSGGQFSVNISKPGITQGQHWHNTKWELFIVIKGSALIRQRKIGTDEVQEYRVSGEKLQAVCMLPGYTHNLINLSETEELITLMWANENFDAERPDTYFEPVE